MADGMTNNLKKAINTKLKTLCDSVYFHRAKQAPASLYAIFDIEAVNYEELIQNVELVVNVFGSGDSTVTLDNKADEIWSAFDHWYFNDGTMVFTTYQSTRTTVVDDTNQNYLHRRLVFGVKVYS